MNRSVCIAILNWRGKKYLGELLPSVVAAAARYPGKADVIFLDNNGPDQEDREWVKKHHGSVRIVAAPSNDYLFSYNELLKSSGYDIFILLNNDIAVEEGFVMPLAAHFDDPSVFSVSARSFSWDRSAVTSGPFLLRKHRTHYFFTPDYRNQNTVYTLFACGGFMAVDRSKFLELGGFDRLYYPAYGEEMDLCFRAWLRGWSSIYEPRSTVRHWGSGSWGGDEHPGGSSEHLNLRSAFLFQWRYLAHLDGKAARFLYDRWCWIRAFLRRDQAWIDSFREARQVWRSRGGEAKRVRVSRVELERIVQAIGRRVA